MRPAVLRAAHACGLAGVARNSATGLVIEIEGPADKLDQFRAALSQELPPSAQVTASDEQPLPPLGRRTFVLEESLPGRPLAAEVPVDLATCEACLADVRRRGERRSEYALTSCTQCGPRYSILSAMPFDRCRTSLSCFPLCAACEREYGDARDRRCHAQTTACSDCGPQMDVDIDRVAEALRAGQIVGLKGLGGYQLAVDATNSAAVRRLRLKKQRPCKPFAIMVADIPAAQRIAVLSSVEVDWLVGPVRPIVLAARRLDGGGESLAAECFHGDSSSRGSTIGLMLPTTAWHALLLERLRRPLVMTSGNLEGDPLEYDVDSAREVLAEVADLLVHHDRDIRRPIDDSVVRLMRRPTPNVEPVELGADRMVVLRNGRGLAPTPLRLAPSGTATSRIADRPRSGSLSDSLHDWPILAVGGHQKHAIAVWNGAQAMLGPHLGDLDALAARMRFNAQVEELLQLYECQPRLIVHDLHPDYFTTRWAEERAESQEIERLAVQHHHAHVVAGMLDNDWLDREVLGVAFDGTGFGVDGTVWGGEFLRATVGGFERVAHLRPFALPGGELAIREPWRVAEVLRGHSSHSLAPQTSSVGRLFAGVASLVLGLRTEHFEGQLAQCWEEVADRSASGSYEMPLTDDSPPQLDWRPMLEEICHDQRAGVSAGSIAMRFHRGLAQAVSATAGRFELPVVLTGGVFQNRLLTELVLAEWPRRGLPVGLHQRVPPNDGGLAAGQLAIGMEWARRTQAESG